VLAKLKKEYKDKGLYFISLTIEDKDSKDIVAGWLKSAKAEVLTAARADKSGRTKLSKMAGLEGIGVPQLILIDKSGRVVNGLEAGFSHKDVEAAVKDLAST
jgi:hypothetical protein